MMPRTSRFAAAMLFIAGFACAAAALDIGLKIITATPLWRVLPVIEPILGRPDIETGYVFMPGVAGVWTRENRVPVQITDLGLRGPAGITPAKPAGVQRIVLLGDSVTEGLQVEYDATFGAVLQTRLNRPGRRAEVLNLAMAGNGPLRQLVRLEQRGFEFDPDIVLMVTSPFDFLTGELRDDSVNPGYVPDGQGGWKRGYSFGRRFSVRHAESLPGKAFLATMQYSDVTRLLYLRSRDPLPKLMGVETAARPATMRAAFDVCQTNDMQRLHRLWLDHEPAQDWQVLEKYFAELASSTRGRPLKVAYALRDLPVPASGCALQQSQREALVATITAYLAARQIVFIDIEARIIAGGREANSYDLRNLHGFGLQLGLGHLNERGHQRYADALLGALEPLLRP